MFGGFSIKNAIKQAGSYLNPTGGVANYDVFTKLGNQRTGLNDANIIDQSQISGFPTRNNTDILNQPLGQTNNTNTAASTAPYGGGGSSAPVFNQAAANATQMSIDQLAGILADALAQEENRFRNTVGDIDRQAAEQARLRDESTVTNQKNYDANYMAALRAGSRGISGLLNILQGTGMEDWGRSAVQGQVADDVREGFDTREENQRNVDNSFNTFSTEADRKRREAEQTRLNNRMALEADNLTKRQTLVGDLAKLYGDAGRTADYNRLTGEAASLTPQIAQRSVAKVQAYNPSTVPVKAAEISAFTAPTEQSVSTSPAGNNQVGAGIYTVGERKREDELVGA